MAEPPDQAPAAAGRGDLRASHADREQVIDTLKAAFVHGTLAKDEFDLRVGRALASRTYAQLAALTADIPAGLAVAQPPEPPWAPGEPGIPRPGRVLTVATALYAGVWMYAVLPPGGADSDANAQRIIIGGLFYLLLLLTVGTQIFANWLDKRSARPLPPGPGPGPRGQASPRPSSADPSRQLPPADPSHQHTAEAPRSRLPRRSLPGSRSLRRWRPGDGPPQRPAITHTA